MKWTDRSGRKEKDGDSFWMFNFSLRFLSSFPLEAWFTRKRKQMKKRKKEETRMMCKEKERKRQLNVCRMYMRLQFSLFHLLIGCLSVTSSLGLFLLTLKESYSLFFLNVDIFRYISSSVFLQVSWWTNDEKKWRCISLSLSVFLPQDKQQVRDVLWRETETWLGLLSHFTFSSVSLALLLVHFLFTVDWTDCMWQRNREMRKENLSLKANLTTAMKTIFNFSGIALYFLLFLPWPMTFLFSLPITVFPFKLKDCLWKNNTEAWYDSWHLFLSLLRFFSRLWQ